MYYYWGGTHYSPIMRLPLTIQGPITSAGGFGSGPGAMVGGALPGGSGLSLGANVGEDAALAAAANLASLGANILLGADIGWSAGPPGAVAGAIIGALAGILEDLLGGGGGGPSEPWWWTREDTHPGGSPSTWAPIYGMPAAYPPNQEKSAGIQFARFIAPFTRLPSPSVSGESPGEGWIPKGPRGNWFYPPTGQSLSPDPNHRGPKGPHWDLQQRGSKQKLSLRMLENELQFWLEGPDVWLPLESLPMLP